MPFVKSVMDLESVSLPIDCVKVPKYVLFIDNYININQVQIDEPHDFR